MLFRDVLFLSSLAASAFATAIHPLLVSRLSLGQCQNQCDPVAQQLPSIESGTCGLSCICTNTFIGELNSCINCLKSEGLTIPGLPSNYVQEVTNRCNSAGYHVKSGAVHLSANLGGVLAVVVATGLVFLSA